MSGKNNLRSSQLLSPFGIGQIVNFPKELSVMVGGLNLWDEEIERGKNDRGPEKISEVELRFNESRLERILGVEYFVKPFPYKTKGSTNNYLTIPAVRFPGWHYCTNARCGRMRYVNLEQANKTIECIACWDGQSKHKNKMIPVRFVAACPSGHIQDVPFNEWVHYGPLTNDDYIHELSYQTGGGSGDLGSIRIVCTKTHKETRKQEFCCSRSLSGLMNIRKENGIVFDSALARIGLDKDDDNKFSISDPNDNNPSGQYCRGHRPWLGLQGIKNAANCGNHLQVLIRGGSNVHFSEIRSAIYLPEGSEDSNQYVIQVIESLGKKKLKDFYDQDKGTVVLPAILGIQDVVSKGFISNEELLEGVISEILKEETEKGKSEINSELELRYEEYVQLLKGRDSEKADFKAIVKTFDEYNQNEFLESHFDCVVLVEKLKETRVFNGFSRISPSYKINRSELSSKEVKWLPAVQVFGEGIFLKFKDNVVDDWLEKDGSKFSGLISRFREAELRRGLIDEPKNINPFFVAMHTFAHLLIKRLCYECGYGSSALRERLYFSDNPNYRMNGFLIYTSSGDADGSLGGLVRQGKEKNLGHLVKNAITDAEWCSADPVCSDIGQTTGQGPDNVNGSACHNCSILPETSCEEFNSLLDRTTLIGSINDPSIGFFQSEGKSL